MVPRILIRLLSGSLTGPVVCLGQSGSFHVDEGGGTAARLSRTGAPRGYFPTAGGRTVWRGTAARGNDTSTHGHKQDRTITNCEPLRVPQDREFNAVVTGEPHRGFYGNQHDPFPVSGIRRATAGT